MKSRKKIIFVFIFLTLLVIGGVVFSRYNIKNEVMQERRNPKVNIGVGDDYDGWWNYGEWNISTIFKSDDASVTISDDGLTLEADSAKVTNDKVNAALSVSGEYVDESSTTDLAAADLVFYFPGFLFSSDFYDYEYVVDSSSNSLSFKDFDGNVFGSITLGQDMPYCDVNESDCTTLENADFFWYFDGSSVNVLNAKEIPVSSGNNYNFSFDINYELSTSVISAMNENSITPYVSFVYDGYADLVELQTNYIVPADQYFAFDNLQSDDVVVYEEWQSEWGSNTVDADFYLKYGVAVDVAYSGTYQVAFYPSSSEGTLVAYSNDGENYLNDVDDKWSYCETEITGASTPKCYFVVAYSLYEDTTTLYTYFSVSIDGSSEQYSDGEYVEWNYTYGDENGGEEPEPPVELEYPLGTSMEHNHSLTSVFANIGAIDKLNSQQEVDFEWLLESASSSISESTDGFVKVYNLWNLTENGTTDYNVELESNGGVLDSSYNSAVNPYSFTSSDYEIKSFYIQDDLEYDYIESDSQYILDLVTDYSTYSDKNVYVKINDGEYELIGTYKKDSVGNIVYTASDSRTSSNDMVSADNRVVLPDNVTAIKVSYTGRRAAIYTGINVTTTVKTSENVLNNINALKSSGDVVLKNNSSLSVNSELIESKSAATILTALESKTNVVVGSTVNEKTSDGSDSITYTSSVYEQVNYNESTLDVARDVIKEQGNVTFYELLPEGAVLDGDVVVKTYGSNVVAESSVITTDNFEGSGRTLVTVNVTVPSAGNVYESSSSIQSGYVLTYNVIYSKTANQSYGNTLNKDMAYYSDGELTTGYVNASNASVNMFSSSAAQNLLAKLNTSNTSSNAVFEKNTVTVDAISVTIGDYNKEVKNESDANYLETTIVNEGRKYSYRLQYIFSSDYEEIQNLVFVDKIESETNSTFKGYFDSVDVSYLTNLGVSTSVYYSTKSDVDVDNVDVSDSTVWSLVKPSDVSTITAIAVDCGSYVFKGAEKVTPMVYINMIAPNSFDDNSEMMASNKSLVKYNNVGDVTVKSITSEVTSVSLAEAPIGVSGTTSLGSGTKDSPIIVNTNYDYVINLNNSSTYDYDNISVNIVLPQGVKFTSLSETSNNENSIDGTYEYDADKNVLTYNVDKLLAEEEKVITLKTNIVLEEVNDGALFEFKANISKVSGNSYDGDVVSLYNKLAIPSLEFMKYVDTLDTDGFVDEATSLISSGEEYSYRVSVSNTSEIVASDVKVVDNVPVGLSVVADSITNSGVYDEDNNTVTWNFDLAEATSINLEYKVVVPDDATLGTVYKSSAKVSLVNPIDNSLMLYDDETNIISTLYQVASDLQITNTISGALADSNKEFEYTLEFVGDVSHVGVYEIQDKDGNVIDKLTIDSSGKGNVDVSLKGNESIKVKLLLGGISYTIKQKVEEGYTASATNSTTENGYVVYTGVTDDTRLVTYNFVNSYAASTKVALGAKVGYEKELNEGLFKLLLSGDNSYSDEKSIDATGIVTFDEITYDNVVGTFIYSISQVNTGVKKVEYDNNVYTAKVVVTNDGKGNLNTEVKYYNNANNEITEVVFNNKYLPSGLTIKNVNTSEYVDANKVFKYKLNITNGVVGSYKVLLNGSEELADLVILDDGSASYEFELKSGEKITVNDLPTGVSYVVTQELNEYYTSSMEDDSYSVDTANNVISHSNTMSDDSIQLIFTNNYVTKASYIPVTKVSLTDKELEENEFNFMLRDISDGITSGYTDYMSNKLDGSVQFKEINYTKPGKYVYEITQVKGDSNHIYYDLTKCILTLVLTDNGDGTMSVVEEYVYEEEKEGFVNEYSLEPIIKDEVIDDDQGVVDDKSENPNTNDRFIIIIGMLVCVVMLFIIERKIRRRRFEMRF